MTKVFICDHKKEKWKHNERRCEVWHHYLYTVLKHHIKEWSNQEKGQTGGTWWRECNIMDANQHQEDKANKKYNAHIALGHGHIPTYKKMFTKSAIKIAVKLKIIMTWHRSIEIKAFQHFLNPPIHLSFQIFGTVEQELILGSLGLVHEYIVVVTSCT